MKQLLLIDDSPEVEASAARVRRLRGAELAAEGSRRDFPRLLETPGLDATIFATEPQEADLERALERGLGCFFPAPFVPSERILERAREAKVLLRREQPERQKPGLIEAKRALDADELGRPLLLRVHRWRSGELDLFSELDLALWIFKSPPETVYATGSDGYVQVHLSFMERAMALLDASRRLPAGDGYDSVSVIAERGAIYADGHHNVQLVYTGGRPSAVETLEERELSPQWQSFVGDLDERPEPKLEALEWVRLTAAAVETSLANRRALERKGLLYELV